MERAMDGSPAQNVLRKILSVRQEEEAANGVPPEKCLAGALAQAAEKALNMPLIVNECSLQDASLSEFLEALPEKGMIAILEGPGETMGAVTLDSPFLASLVEQQTIGSVSAGDPPSRRATRTDAALCADWIDILLRKFEEPMLSTKDAVWTAGYGFSAAIPDPRPLALMLEDAGYRLFRAKTVLGAVGREAEIQIALLANGRGPKPQNLPPAAVMPGSDTEDIDKEVWAAALKDAVESTDSELRGVLHRLEKPLDEIDAMEVGTCLHIPISAIGRVAVEAPDGNVVAYARLGQSAGQRALRLLGDVDEAATPEFAAPVATGLPGPGSLETTAPDLDMPDLPDIPDLSDLPGADLLSSDGEDTASLGGDLPDIGGDLGDLEPPELPALDELPELPEITLDP
ncbi:MAG: FliM/FliN family flagellar motor C-terminal domain-containing protein [Pseudomonadota bacterium]